MNLQYFQTQNLFDAGKQLFDTLEIPLNTNTSEPIDYKKILGERYKPETYDIFNSINEVYFFGAVDDSVFFNTDEKTSVKEAVEKDREGIFIFGIDLNWQSDRLPSRSKLAFLVRAFNRISLYNPVIVLFRYKNHISIATTERIEYKIKKQGEKLGKVSILKDINTEKPHRAHVDILQELSVWKKNEQKNTLFNIFSYEQLYQHWRKTFDVDKLNKEFYKEIFYWYLWAKRNIDFYKIVNKTEQQKLDKDVFHSETVIRLLTRLIFSWFVKEKQLIPEELFNAGFLKNHIKNFDKNAENSSEYYLAILQNLFFATLNTEMPKDGGERAFINDKKGYNDQYLDHLAYRHKNLFTKPAEALKLFENIPFLNGGLFECLDRREGKTEYRYDGFSTKKSKQPHIPNRLFFGSSASEDFTGEIEKKKQYKDIAVTGIINILNRYKFTIEENTPLEQEIALDPELLGKIFENLLASYSPETGSTARKQMGAYYTPREIVNYMVDESLIAYLSPAIFQIAKHSPSTFQVETNPSTLKVETNPSTLKVEGLNFYDKNKPIQITARNRPHWQQEGVVYFVTFRLADSIPKKKQLQLKKEREDWFKKHKEPYTKEEKRRYYYLFSERVDEWLANGYGSCILKHDKNAKIVADALKFFDGKRYQLYDWVVMPNHVHVLVQPIGKWTLDKITHSWKSFTSNRINEENNLSGRLWEHESFDHIVRNDKSFDKFTKYILDNPKKAGITVSQISTTRHLADDNSSTRHLAGENSDVSKQDAWRTWRTFDSKIRQLFSYETDENPFENQPEINEAIIQYLSDAKILDPACGSGAFPMGVLHQIVHVLGKVDPNNQSWKKTQLEKAKRDLQRANDFEDGKIREQAVQSAEQRIEFVKASFDNPHHELDYQRKLFLIENSIFGIDKLNIAVQISKLRFFISLMVEQQVIDSEKNRNMLSLPNLETKFVAADTLIALDKPQILKSAELEKAEKDLEEVRHQIFYTRSYSQKKKLKRKEAEKRQNLKNELIKSGYKEDAATKMTEWSPFNTMISAPFFDSQTMFGFDTGFDVVIGNPPYVRKTSINKTNSKYYDTNFFSAFKQYDLYILFIEQGMNFLQKEGELCYINPNKFFVSEYGEKIRELLLTKYYIRQIVDVSQLKVFENVTTYPCLMSIQKSFNYNQSIYYSCITDLSYISHISQKDFKPFEYSDFSSKNSYKLLFDSNGDIIDLIETNTDKIENIFICKRGLPNNKIVKNLTNGYHAIKSTDIDKYKINKSDLKVSFSKKDIENKYINEFSNELILLPRTVLSLKVALSNSKAIILDRVYYLINKSPNYLNKYIIAILNSKIISFWFDFYYSSTKIQGGYFDLRGTQINSIPIYKNKIEIQIIFKLIVDYILHIKQSQNQINENVNNEHLSQKFEELIDAMVYELYFEESVKKAGCEVISLVSKLMQPIEGIEDENKIAAIINEAYEHLQNPDSELRKRIEKQQSVVEEVKIINESLKK